MALQRVMESREKLRRTSDAVKETVSEAATYSPELYFFKFFESSREKMLKQGTVTDCQNVEIEARLGLFLDHDEGRYGSFKAGACAVEVNDVNDRTTIAAPPNKFEAGIPYPDFRKFKDLMSKSGAEKKNSFLIRYNYSKEGHPLQGTRLVEQDGKVRAESKTKCVTQDLNLPSCPYDVRLTVSYEMPGSYEAVPAGWDLRREITRSSYTIPEAGWVCDISRVATTNPTVSPDQKEITYEVEFEMLPATRDALIRAPKDVVQNSRECAKRLWEVIQKLMPCHEAQGGLDKISNPSVLESVKDLCFSAARDWNETGGFPGTMPIGFGRRDIPTVQQAEYFVSEKTDGLRFWLVVTKLGCVLVNRKFEIFKLPGLDEIGRVFGEGTIVDGEVVHNIEYRRDVFMAFDVVMNQHAKVCEECFTKRIAVLQEIFDSYVRVQPTLSPETVLVLMKNWEHKSNLERVFDCVRMVKGERVFRHQRGTICYHHKTDGVILCPNTPYKWGTDMTLYKWKWQELLSIDFKCKLVQNVTRISFRSGHDEHVTEIDFTDHMNLVTHDEKRLRGDMRGHESIVAEFVYLSDYGIWRYKIPRPDKPKPNFANTVFDTLLELASGISEEELKYRIIFFDNPSNDDWATQNVRAQQNFFAGKKKYDAQQRQRSQK